MRRSDFNYDLPSKLIAQYPLACRTASRLLIVDRPVLPDGDSANASGLLLADRGFSDLPDLLAPDDLLVFNDTRVMRARMHGRKLTGGRVEILIERLLEPRLALAQLRSSKPPKSGAHILLDHGDTLEVTGRNDDLFQLRAPNDDFCALMERYGQMPLPPYIQRPNDASDHDRYQTVFAQHDGAVAAPTAGLHFDALLLERLTHKGVRQAAITLHVGAGTFQPVRVDDLSQHRMHSEWLEVDQALCEQIAITRARGGRVVAVGTTSVRALESAAATGVLRPFRGETQLFITPGYQFRVVDAMITNFHLPESTLLMLVSAFGGYHAVMQAYRHAVAQEYRFFSYGDAMFLERS